MKFSVSSQLELFSIFVILLLCSAVYCKIPERNLYSKRDAKATIKRSPIEDESSLRNTGYQVGSGRKVIVHKRDIEDEEDDWSETKEEIISSSTTTKVEIPTWKLVTGLSFSSLTEHEDVLADQEEVKRKKGQHINIPLNDTDSKQNSETNALDEDSKSKSSITIPKPETNSIPEAESESESESARKIYKENKNYDDEIKNAKKFSKHLGTHLSSPNHEEQAIALNIAKKYSAELQSSSFFGHPQIDEDEGPTVFTVANTNVGRTWESIPYREKFQWNNEDAPCFTFIISVPDERTGHESLPICIFRTNLEYKEESSLIIHQEEKNLNVYEQRERKVSGQVLNVPNSAVYGRFVDTYFYGEISMTDPETSEEIVYVIEEIKLLSRLLRHSHKLVNNLLTVMQNQNTTKHTNDSTSSSSRKAKFNAVVTKGVSILSFVSNPNPNSEDFFRSFVILSTNQNSYITSGEPLARLDENGRLIFATGENIITIDTDESVKLKTKEKEYTFRPRGKTMVSVGMNAEALRQLEGVVAVTAITKSMTYSCVLPSPSFIQTRQGGFICKVCMAADKSFREKYMLNSEVKDASHFLGQIIDRVSWIFRSIDWNLDAKPDNVGLDYDLQYFNWNYPDDDSEEEVSEEGLELLFTSVASVDFSDCCLGISYTMRMFPPDIYAKSSPSKPMAPAGACAIQNDGISNNAILISANNKEGNFSSLTEDQLIYLTTREIAKAFGATPDTSGQTGCDSFVDSKGDIRHYLLWPDVMRNVTSEEKAFSICSQKSIFDALSSCKSSCFDVDHHPFCGNGIEEEGEECDCGSEHECSLQYCCYGRTGKYPCRKTGGPCQTINSTAAVNSATSVSLTALLFFGLILF